MRTTALEPGFDAGLCTGETRTRRALVSAGRFIVPVAFAAALLGGLALAALLFRGEGYRVVIVHGGSMGDAIPNGSLAVVQWRPASAIAAGDVIVISEDATATPPKIHRVIEVAEEDGSYVVLTQGDANQTPDPEPYVLPDRVLVSREHVPYLGWVAAAVASPLGWLLLVALPVTIVGVVTIDSIWRRRKRAAGS